MNKLMAIWSLIGQGRQVADPVFWKKVQSVGQPALASLLIGIIAILKGTKYEIQIDDATLGLIAGGLFAVVNWVLTHITTSKNIDILPTIKPFEDVRSNEPVVPDPAPCMSPIEPAPIWVQADAKPIPKPSRPAPVDPNLYGGG